MPDQKISELDTKATIVSNDYLPIVDSEAGPIQTKKVLFSTIYNLFEPAISPGLATEYFRGDKAWATLNQAAVAGLTTADMPTFAGLNSTDNIVNDDISDPSLFLREGGSPTAYTRLFDLGITTARLQKISDEGISALQIDPIVGDAFSNSYIHFFRLTNTSGDKCFVLYKGDGSSAIAFSVVNGVVNLKEAGNIVLGTTTGSQVATAANQKLAFHGATPVVQAAHIANPTDLASAITAINAILVALENKGILASS